MRQIFDFVGVIGCIWFFHLIFFLPWKWLNVDFVFSDVAPMERLRLAATNQVALEAKWISRNFQQILFSLSTKWICWKFQNYNSFPKTWKWRTSAEISLHPFFILEEWYNFLLSLHQRFSWRLRENDKCFLYTSLAVTIGWSLFGSDRQICQCWYCSFPLFDFFQLFPINPFFLQIIAPIIYLFHIYYIYY